MRLFKRATIESGQAASPSDIEVVRQKIATCEQEIAAAEVKLRRASLQAALGDDAEAVEAARQLQALGDRRELLTLGLAEAERIEGEKRAALHAREWQARKRSLAQKTGQLQRDGHEVSDALKQLHQAIERFTATGASIVPLLPRQMQTDARPFHVLLSGDLLRDFVQLERRRLGDQSAKPRRLGNFMQIEDPMTAQVKPLVEHIADLCSRVKAQFEATSGVSAPTPATNEPSPPPVLVTQALSEPEVADVLLTAPVAPGSDPSTSSESESGQAAREVTNE